MFLRHISKYFLISVHSLLIMFIFRFLTVGFAAVERLVIFCGLVLVLTNFLH